MQGNGMRGWGKLGTAIELQVAETAKPARGFRELSARLRSSSGCRSLFFTGLLLGKPSGVVHMYHRMRLAQLPRDRLAKRSSLKFIYSCPPPLASSRAR